MLEWLLRRSGPLTSTVAEGFAFVRSHVGLRPPTCSSTFAPAYFVDNGFADFDGHAITLGPAACAARAGRGAPALRRPAGQAGDPRQLP